MRIVVVRMPRVIQAATIVGSQHGLMGNANQFQAMNQDILPMRKFQLLRSLHHHEPFTANPPKYLNPLLKKKLAAPLSENFRSLVSGTLGTSHI